ncbi:Glycoside hydrolase, family GH5_42 [Tenacibaculum maritimum]|uniref:cellulase family glycosylhydrolase n=1 Tax=Tenacibaculum maritimum TaxID=107401 RepID=UPI0012E6E98B|nr:cellulase family glycosylhydrolase [Tenacibaculum maritimum]CAA0235488.1 Glycoside hydrolase, family GH5_42 [Tenacibaculum maritimum]
MVKTDRNIIRGLLILSYVFVISILLFLISTIFNYFNTGADRSKMLHINIKKTDKYLPKITWKENGNEGRFMDSQTLLDIENDYLDAWHVRHIAYKTNKILSIDDYYTENAQKSILHFIEKHITNDITIESTTLEHHPDILFFSEDGQLVVLEDKNILEYKKMYVGNKLVTEDTEVANYKIILLLEDGFWRIRHFVKEKTTSYNKKSTPVSSPFLNIRGINYYPQKTPWNMFGEQFDIDVINRDFEIIRDACLNSIRVFVPYVDFGKAKVKKDKLDKLTQVLDSAEKNGLKVILTLFDFYGNYEVLDWTLNHRHAESIVTALKDHEALLAWDIKNEPNLDFKSRGKNDVIAWLKHMIYLIKSIDTTHPITIGWSDAESATILKDDVDFVSFHYYEDLENFESIYQTLQQKITDRPIVLGEFGISSYSGLWKPFGGSEEDQAAYYQEMQKVIKKHHIPFMSWTLYDFKKIPAGVVGTRPWRTNPQKEFGFINLNGDKKASFKFIAE